MTKDESAFPERSCGRDVAKKAAHGGSSSSSGKGKAVARYSETFDNLSKKLDGLFEASRERINLGKQKVEIGRKRLESKNTQLKLAQLKVLSTDYGYLNEEDRSIMEKAKEEYREKYR
uniref:uncharacterized protein LOC122583213 n=1 Tax=Erigeron canadensis TaxID=72917 RepID=UPI001CB89703|nr:uncharacterized protein LOC122583213 [Erigeron canadensis]